MPLRFTNCRLIPGAHHVDARKGLPPGDIAVQRGVARIMTPSDLDALEREQVVACVRRSFGTRRPVSVEGLFAPDRDRNTDEAAFAGGDVEWWDVLDDAEQPRYRLWLYHGDCGSLFAAGQTQVLAEVVQFGFTYPGDTAAWGDLARAQADAAGLYPDSLLASMDFSTTDDEP